MVDKVKVSTLGKTWIFDIDGTLVKHNGYKIDGHDTMLPGVRSFFQNLSKDDIVILITSRKLEYRKQTEAFLRENGIKYNHIIFELPYGERILVNDRKPSGLQTSIAVNTDRDVFMQTIFEKDESL